MNVVYTHPACVRTYVISATQTQFGPGAVNSRSTRSSGHSSALAEIVFGRFRFRRIPSMPNWRINRSTVHRATCPNWSVHPRLTAFHINRCPVAGIVRLIDILDHRHQSLIPTGPGRWLTFLNRVIRAHSNPCRRPLQSAHDWCDTELVEIIVDEGDDYFDGQSSSAAKKAEALLKPRWLVSIK